MKPTRADREFERFVETPSGDTAVRVLDENSAPLSAPGIGDLQSFNGTAAAAVGSGGPLAGRRGVFIQPTAAGLFLGFSAGVTSTTGIKLFQDQLIFIEAGPSTPVYLITTGPSITARVWEVK